MAPSRVLESRLLGVRRRSTYLLEAVDAGLRSGGGWHTSLHDGSDECSTALPRLARAHREMCSLGRIPLCKVRSDKHPRQSSPRSVAAWAPRSPARPSRTHRVPRTSSRHLSVTYFSGLQFSQASDFTILPHLSVMHPAHLERSILPRCQQCLAAVARQSSDD